MKLLLTSILLCITLTTTLHAQNFETVDGKVKLYSKGYASAEALAAQIDKDFKTDVDKVRAIFTWLAHNIRYDLEAYYNGETRINFSYTDKADLRQKLSAINTHTVNQTFRQKRAVCEGYAQTFKKVSELLGIPCLFISGYSKSTVNDINNIPEQANHAWNAVRINNKWYLIDATWGAGHTHNRKWTPHFDDYFFFTNPEEFALSHLPEDANLSFTKKKISRKIFYNKPIFGKAFLKNKLQLLSPLQGELVVTSNSTIDFEMGDIPNNISLHYAFQENMRPTEIQPSCIGSKCSFEIPFTQNNNTVLYIIVNRQTALQYKIKVEK